MYIRAPVVCLILTLQNTAAKRSAYGISGSSGVHPRRHRRSPVFCCSVRSHSSCDAHTQLISFQKPGPRQIRTSWKGGAHDLRPCFLELHLVYQEPVPEIKDQWCESMLLSYQCAPRRRAQNVTGTVPKYLGLWKRAKRNSRKSAKHSSNGPYTPHACPDALLHR